MYVLQPEWARPPSTPSGDHPSGSTSTSAPTPPSPSTTLAPKPTPTESSEEPPSVTTPSKEPPSAEDENSIECTGDFIANEDCGKVSNHGNKYLNLTITNYSLSNKRGKRTKRFFFFCFNQNFAHQL